MKAFYLKNFSFIFTFFVLLQGCVPPPPSTPTGEPNPVQFIFSTVWFFLIGLFVYWYLVLKPNQVKTLKHGEFIKSLRKNDEVVTSSGIFGRIVAVKDDFISIEIAPNIKIRITPEHVQQPPKRAEEKSENNT